MSKKFVEDLSLWETLLFPEIATSVIDITDLNYYAEIGSTLFDFTNTCIAVEADGIDCDTYLSENIYTFTDGTLLAVI